MSASLADSISAWIVRMKRSRSRGGGVEGGLVSVRVRVGVSGGCFGLSG